MTASTWRPRLSLADCYFIKSCGITMPWIVRRRRSYQDYNGAFLIWRKYDGWKDQQSPH
jgi:hypothetical protein